MSNPSLFFEHAKAATHGKHPRLWLGVLWLLGFLMCALAPTASGQEQIRLLDAPRAAGVVGERYDGYAVARGMVSPEIAALVDKVNAERRAVYAQRAATDGVPLEVIGKIYAAEIIKAAPPGTWFLSDTGQWIQK